MPEALIHLEAYMGGFRLPYSSWYVGITAKPRERLFDGHRLVEHQDAYIARDCGSADAARSIEAYLLSCGCKGGPGGGDWTARHVYVYRMAPHTKE